MYSLPMVTTQIIARFNRGGTARWLDTLINGLSKTGYVNTLLCGYVQEGEFEDQSMNQLAFHRIENLGRRVSFRSDVRSFLEIRAFLKSHEIELINTHTAKAGVLGRLAAISLGKKRPAIVHTFHGHLLYGYFGGVKLFVIKKIEKILARKTDVIISAGTKVMEDLLENGIGRREQFVVARPGIELKMGGLIDFRKSLGIGAEHVVVGWLGRLTEIKKPHRLLNLARKFPEIQFMVGGEGHLRHELEQNCPKNVHFVGWAEAKSFWAACDIALLTSANEAQPISLIEAGLSGCTAIAENVGSVSEVVSGGKTGFLVVGRLQRESALRELIENRELREIMGKAAKKYCEEKFSRSQFIGSHLIAYQMAVSRNKRKIS